MSDNIERLEKVLGGRDLLKSTGTGGEALKRAIEKIKKEQTEANEKKAEELIRKALELHGKKVELEKQFNGNMKKIDKELGKAISAIENLGKSGAPEESKEAEASA